MRFDLQIALAPSSSLGSKLFDMLSTHYTQAQRTADVKIVVKQLSAYVPTIVMQMREDMFALNSDLKNYHPNSVTPFDNMFDVDI